MRIDQRCFSCLLSRVAFECGLSTNDGAHIQEIVDACARVLNGVKTSPIPAPWIASEVHHCAYRMLPDTDPYRRLKEDNMRTALTVCRQVQSALPTFRDVVLASIIGNTMDYAVENHHVADDFSRFFRKEFEKGLYIDHTDAMLQRSDRVVYFTDNCGEIVFDCLVIRALKERGAHITLVVKGEPILNDATVREAKDLGLDGMVDLLTTTGSGDVGITLGKIPLELNRALDECTLIIAKGMANYESLSEVPGLPPVAYLMAVKCDPIAESVGVPRESYIALLTT